MTQHSIGSPAAPPATPRARALGDRGEELAANGIVEGISGRLDTVLLVADALGSCRYRNVQQNREIGK